MEDTIVNEKNKYNKAYTELMFCVDDLRKMLDTEELEKRSFISKVDTLKDYIEFLDNLEKESKNDKGLFKKLFKIENDSNQKISKYLTLDKRRDLEKIDKCSKCACRNCVSICNMNHCFNCREKEYIVKCDKDTTLLTKTTDTVELYQGDEKFVFNVAGYLVEKDDNGSFSRYVYLIDSKDYDNQHILKYSKFKGEESYDSVITDGTQDELIRINDKFIEMGLRV